MFSTELKTFLENLLVLITSLNQFGGISHAIPSSQQLSQKSSASDYISGQSSLFYKTAQKSLKTV